MRLPPALLLIPTGVYLVTEVAFASYLVEFLGSAPSKAEVLALEWWGRALTGVALALLLIPTILKRLPPIPVLSLLVSGGLLVGSVALAQVAIDRLVTALTEATTAEERRLALIVQAGVQRIHAQEDGQPALHVNEGYLPVVLRESVPGRFILAGLPFLLGQAEGIERRLVDVLTQAAEERSRREIGPPEALFNQTYRPLMEQAIIRRYNGYVEAVNAARRGMQGRIRQADEDWQAYLSSLQANGLNHAVVPEVPRLRSAVSRRLRQQNPNFPPDWVPRQREDFDQVYADQVRSRFRTALGQLRLAAPAPELEDPERLVSPRDFVALPAVRETWRKEVAERVADQDFRDRLSAMGPQYLTTALAFLRFTEAVYGPAVEAKLAVERGRLQGAVAAYGRGGQYAAEAYDAAKLMIVVPLALGFSTLGALTHAGKALGLSLLALGLGWGRAIAIVMMAALVVLSAGQWAPRSAIVARPEVAAMQAGLSAYQRLMMRTAIAVQQVLYPSGLTIRRALGRDPT